MKISKIAMEDKAKRITDNLLCWCGLVKAKQIVIMVKKNLTAEYKRRKKLDEK